jgi:hypothetical protein
VGHGDVVIYCTRRDLNKTYESQPTLTQVGSILVFLSTRYNEGRPVSANLATSPSFTDTRHTTVGRSSRLCLRHPRHRLLCFLHPRRIICQPRTRPRAFAAEAEDPGAGGN